MNLRDCRRLSRFLHRRRGSKVDIFAYLAFNNFSIRWSLRRNYYICRFSLDGQRYVRAHSCAWMLSKIVYGMAASRHADFEGTMVNAQQQKALGVLSAVKQQIHPSFPIRAAPNYGKPHVLSRKGEEPKMQKAIGEIITDHYGHEMAYKVEHNWTHSSLVTDPNLISPGFNKLAHRPAQPLNREVAAIMLLQQIIRQKQQYGADKHEVDLTVARLATPNKNGGSASGILPICTVPGVMAKTTGKKEDMHPAAYAVNLHNRLSGEIPRSIPYKVFLKGEVIKRNKNVRGIQNESLATYEILSLSEPEREEVRLGNAIGMGGGKKSFASIFVVWYREFYEHSGQDWFGFINYLQNKGAHESDKVGWEASTNITDCLPRLIVLLNEKKFRTPDCKRLYVAAVTDSHFPFIYLHREQFQCPARVPSGTYFTSKGNTARHRSMNDYVCHYVHVHDYRLGAPGCTCHGCCRMSNHVAFGRDITKLELALRRKAFILGDDYLSLSWGYEEDSFFDHLMDTTFGTQTKTECKAFFDDAEFLRKKFKLGEEGNITWYREPERVLAKIFHGEFLRNPQRMAEALTSYKFEAGDNEELVDCIDAIYKLVGDNVTTLDMSRYAAKRPVLEDVTLYHQFTVDDVVNYQRQFARTVENVLLEKF